MLTLIPPIGNVSWDWQVECKRLPDSNISPFEKLIRSSIKPGDISTLDMPISLPKSYGNLPFKQIRIHHHPSSSPEPTPVLILEIYRPKNGNAFTEDMREEIRDAYALFSADDRVKCIVMTGSGNRFFCAGADLSIGFRKDGGSSARHRDGGGIAALAIHNCTKPTIGAINGTAVGVGLTITFPMAIRVVSNKAKFGLVFARRGIITDAVSSFFLPRLIGASKSLHLLTTGAVYPSTHELFRELFTELVEPDEVLPRALALAEEVVAQTSMVSNKLIRDLIWHGPGDADSTHLLESRLLYDLFDAKDNAEGVKSFMEKRQAEFRGTMKNDAPDAWPWWTPANVESEEDREHKFKSAIKDKAKL